MENVCITCQTGAGILFADSPVRLGNPCIEDRLGKPTGAALLAVRPQGEGMFRHIFDASGLCAWSPDHPVLYVLKSDEGTVRFGYCELRPFGNQALLLNGRPVYMRGYIRGITAHEHPNMTGGTVKEAAVKNIRQAKKYGFNLARFHSTIPWPEFVEAADEEGLFIHAEIGFAYERDENGEKKNLSMDNSAWRETLLRYRNCPSMAIFCIGNEMHNSGHFPEVRALYEEGRRLAPGKLIMDNSGWGEFDRDTADVYSQHVAYFFPYGKHADMFHVEAPWLINGSAYDVPLDTETSLGDARSRVHRTVVPARPTLAHEAVHYIEIPDFRKLADKFDAFCAKVGPQYLADNGIKRPRFMDELPKLIARKGLTEVFPHYVAASEKFKMACVKTYLEKCRLSSLCGFEMLQFADCLKYENKNGIVDCFDDDKYIPADWMRQFNDNAAILVDLPSPVLRSGEELACDLYVSDFLEQPALRGDILLEAVRGDGRRETLYAGKDVTLVGGLQKILTLRTSFQVSRDTAEEIALAACFKSPEVTLTNSWNLWVYPVLEPAVPAQNLVVREVVDDALFEDLAAGREVLLLLGQNQHLTSEKYAFDGTLERMKPCIWDRGSNLGGVIASERLQKVLGCGRYFDLNLYALVENSWKVNLDHFPVKVNEVILGVDKPVRDRMKGIVNDIHDFLDDDTLRNFSHLFSVSKRSL
ncbi:MAG: hypothetical protein IJJ33_10805 [Victivallales bacterium]|nr:hypothetical protein [Victivallales bacterium]